MDVKVKPEAEAGGTFGTMKYDDPQFYNLMRLAFGVEDGEEIASIEMDDDHMRAYFRYDEGV